MKQIRYFLLAVALLTACGTPKKTEEPTAVKNDLKPQTEAFWNSLKALQGKSFEGKLADPAAGGDAFSGKKLVMHVLFADEQTILIPFNVGDDRSRTWIFKRQYGRIELKHDHRLEDGSPDKDTMYGGTSTNSGSGTMQIFPADEQTLELIPAAFTNIWWVTVNDTAYTYNLRRMGTDRVFTVLFDLKTPIETPLASWGWENFGK